MTFPQVQGTPASGATGAGANTTSHVLNLPTGIVAGELLLAVLSNDSNGSRTHTWPAGWTELLDVSDPADVVLTVGWRIADGSEGASITVTSSGSERGAYWVARIGSWHGITAPEVSVAATGVGTAANPGFLQPSWGAADTLFIALAAADHGQTTFTVAPTSFTDLANVEEGSAGGASLGVARRELNAVSIDPTTFTSDASEQWVAATLAISPAAGGPITMAASISSASSVSASLVLAVALSASIASTSIVSAAVQAGEAGQMAASISSTSTISASLHQLRPIAASVSATSTVSATLALAIPLDASIISAGPANYRGPELYRSSLGYREATGAAVESGGMRSFSTISADLKQAIPLSAVSIVGVSSISAHLTGPVNWQVFIDGVEHTDFVRPFNALRIVSRSHEGSGTATIPIRDDAGTLTIETDQVLKVIQRSSTLFEGPIRKIGRGDPGWSTGPRLYTLECQDYTTYLDDDVIATAYRSTAESDKARVTWLINTHSTRGITAAAEVQTLLASMPLGEDGRPEQDFGGKSLRAALDQICQITGGRYYVDFSKRLHYFLTESIAAPYILSDDYDGTTSVGYSNFSLDDDSIEKAHEVLVVGTEAKPDEGIAAVKVWRSIASPPPLGQRRRGVIRDDDITTVAQANQVGDAYLDQYGTDRNTGSVSTSAPGIRAGQTVQIVHAAHGTNSYRIAAVTAYTISAEEVRFDLELNDAALDLGDVISGQRRSIDVLQTTVSAAAASVSQLQAAGANLLPDSSFEASVNSAWTLGTGWTHGVTPTLPALAHRGQNVARVVRAGSGSGTLAPAAHIPVDRASDYQVSIWSFVRSISGAGAAAQFYLYEYDAASAIVAQTLLWSGTAADTAWTRRSAHYGSSEQLGRRAFHANTVKVKPVVFLTGSVTGTWDVDGIQIERGKLMTAYAPMPEELYNVPGEVVIDESGITIINGALTVKNPGGTVIIDGTSNMFKIAATGTLSKATSHGDWVANAAATLTGLTDGGLTRAHVSLIAGNNNATANQHLGIFPYAGGDAPRMKFAPTFVGGTDDEPFVAPVGLAEVHTRSNGTNPIVEMSCYNAVGANRTFYCRYYILQEAAL